eukprot:scaffold2993_cov154-Cylindrotheca_fusiformis.AAC.2
MALIWDTRNHAVVSLFSPCDNSSRTQYNEKEDAESIYGVLDQAAIAPIEAGGLVATGFYEAAAEDRDPPAETLPLVVSIELCQAKHAHEGRLQGGIDDGEDGIPNIPLNNKGSPKCIAKIKWCRY